MEPAEQQRKKRIGSLLPSDSRDLAPGLGPRVTCTAWPIGGRDSLPSPSHLRKPRGLTGPAARWVALPGALQPLLLQCSQESFCGIQFRFQLCDLQEWFTDSCRHLVRSPQPLYFSQPNTWGQNWLTPGHPLGRGSSSHCPKPRSGLLLFKKYLLYKRKKANTKTACRLLSPDHTPLEGINP